MTAAMDTASLAGNAMRIGLRHHPDQFEADRADLADLAAVGCWLAARNAARAASRPASSCG
jgi:hypothetical protein